MTSGDERITCHCRRVEEDEMVVPVVVVSKMMVGRATKRSWFEASVAVALSHRRLLLLREVMMTFYHGG